MNMGITGQDSQQVLKITLLVSLTLLSFAVVTAGISVGVTILLAHLFYIPIVLEAYWFHRKLPVFAIGIGVVYLLLVVAFGGTALVLFTAAGRAVVFVAISVLTAYLSEHLHDEEQRFSCLIGSVSDPLLWMSGSGTVAYVNDAYCSLAGTSAEALTGTVHRPIFCKDAGDMDGFLATLSPEHVSATIDSVIAGAGRDHVIQWNIRAQYTVDGTLSGLIIIGRDITSLRETQTALIRNVETLKAIFTNARECLIIGTCDKDGMPGQILDVNRYGYTIFGYTLAEIQSLSLKNLFPDSLSYIHTAMDAGDAGITDGHIEIRARGKDGARFPVEVAVSSYELHGERFYLLAMRDVTAWVSAQKTLEESERRFRDFADFLPVPAFEAQYDGTIDFRNRTAQSFFGYDEADWMGGITVYSLVDAGEQPELREMFQICLIKDTIISNEFTALHRDGTTFPVMVYCRRIMEEGIVTGLRVLVADLTDQRGVEKALNRSETMYRTVFENTGTSMFLLNADGTIVNANRTAMELVGYPLGDLLSGETVFADLIIPDDRIGFRENAVQMFSGTLPPRILPSVRLRDAGGMQHDTRITLSFIPDSYQLTVSLTDETGKHQSERLIAVSNGVIQLIIYEGDSSHLLMSACTEFGRLDQYYVVSIALCRDGELITSGVSSASFQETNAAFISTSPAPREAVSTKMVSYSPWMTESEEGTEEEIDVFVLPMIASDQVEGVLSVFIRPSATVTEQELTTLQALANDIAYGIWSRRLEEEKVEALSQIERNMEDLSILNDHIRNPLQVILGLSEMGDEKYFDAMSAQVSEIDDIIRRLDQRCLESEKIRDFLQKHYHFDIGSRK